MRLPSHSLGGRRFVCRVCYLSTNLSNEPEGSRMQHRSTVHLSRARERQRRRDQRFHRPVLVFAFDDRYHLSVNCSLGGALISGYFGNLKNGSVIDGTVQLVSESTTHPIRGIVVRHFRERGELALRFVDLSDSTFKLLEECATNRRR